MYVFLVVVRAWHAVERILSQFSSSLCSRSLQAALPRQQVRCSLQVPTLPITLFPVIFCNQNYCNDTVFFKGKSRAGSSVLPQACWLVRFSRIYQTLRLRRFATRTCEGAVSRIAHASRCRLRRWSQWRCCRHQLVVQQQVRHNNSENKLRLEIKTFREILFIFLGRTKTGKVVARLL